MSDRKTEDELLQDLLVKTSRTFALAIPLLPEPTMREVTVAYLLFRIADTFEDATVHWDRTRQIDTLHDFARLIENPTEDRVASETAKWLEDPPTDHAGYLELLEKTPEVVRAYKSLAPQAREIIVGHTVRTARGMARIAARRDETHGLRLKDLPDLQDYCYIVAGIVGEMLAELFLLGRRQLDPIASFLRERSARFGEGLQLVNILKDAASDDLEGRRFLPPDLDRQEVFRLAREDLDVAAEYCRAIQGAGGADEIVSFTALPVGLAKATLDRVERLGPGSKISRLEVFEIYNRLRRAVAEKRPVLSWGG